MTTQYLDRIIKKFGTGYSAFDLFSAANAYNNCIKSNNEEWRVKHLDKVEELLLGFLPHGSGIDHTWKFEIDAYDQIKCTNSYHCMDENGMYSGWIDFELCIKPNFDFKLTGRFSKQFGLRDYLKETFSHALNNLKALNEISHIINCRQQDLSAFLSVWKEENKPLNLGESK